MKVLLKSVKIIEPGTALNGQTKDLVIHDGVIAAISESGTSPTEGYEIIAGNQLNVSPGWFDLHVNLGEPGYEQREDLISGTLAAATGGFTGVLCMPSTEPALDSKSGIAFIQSRTNGNIVDVIPAGAITVNRDGKDLAELYDMWISGAPAFTDDQRPLQNAGMMQKALQYCKDFGAKVMVFPEDKDLAGKGQMNEGETSTSLGIKGSPSIAETLIIQRDLKLLEYTGGSVHFSTISTAASVDLIRAAKSKGLKVTADVSVHHLYFNDQVLEGFDTNFKVKPPIRTEVDRIALIEGLKDGTIDAITTDHRPFDIESKKKEFDLASFGIAGLETGFGAINQAVKNLLPMESIINCLAIHPRKILGLPIPTIKIGEKANLTIFDATSEWLAETQHLKSKGCNNPFIGKKLKGKSIAIINNNKIFKSSEN